jgi:molecular chaperone GrpE (heat shock protein)
MKWFSKAESDAPAVAEAVPDDAPPATAEALLAAVAARQDDLTRLFEDRLRSDAVQADALRYLHDELQAYREDFVRAARRPVLKEVMQCYDFVAAELDRAATPEAPALEHVKSVLTDLLFKYDIEPGRVEGDDFDREAQQGIRTVATTDPALDRKVAARGLIGFRERGAVLRKEQVTVYKFTPAPGATPCPL